MIALQENTLTSLATGMFDHLSSIKTIYLQKNSISEIERLEIYTYCIYIFFSKSFFVFFKFSRKLFFFIVDNF